MPEDISELPQSDKQLNDLTEKRRGTDTLIDPNIPRVQQLLERFIDPTNKNRLPDIEIPYDRNDFWPRLSMELIELKNDYKDQSPLEEDSNFQHLPTALRNVNREIRHQQEMHDAEDKFMRDALTGAYSQAYFKERFKQEITHDLEAQHPVTVLQVDVDDFKKVNDSLGHEGGDILLQQIVTFLKDTVRLDDKVIRSGGDEFVIYIKGVYPDGVLKIAQRIHEHSQNMPFKFSIGIATNDGKATSAAQLLKEADIAAYNSKKDKEGNPLKNRFTVFEEGMTMPSNENNEER